MTKKRKMSPAVRRALRRLRKSVGRYLAKRSKRGTCYTFQEARSPKGSSFIKPGTWVRSSRKPKGAKYSVTHCYASKKALLARFRKGRRK